MNRATGHNALDIAAIPLWIAVLPLLFLVFLLAGSVSLFGNDASSGPSQIGLMIAVSTPCTLAGASVWTRKAGGNDAVSLLTTRTALQVDWIGSRTERAARGIFAICTSAIRRTTTLQPARVTRKLLIFADHSMARHHNTERVFPVSHTHSTGCGWLAKRVIEPELL